MIVRAISIISSEILLTIITLALAIPILVYFEALLDEDASEAYKPTLNSCIMYHYVNETAILVFNNCERNINIYSILGAKNRVKILYYNTDMESLIETETIHAKRLHLLLVDAPTTKIVMNTSEGILIIKR